MPEDAPPMSTSPHHPAHPMPPTSRSPSAIPPRARRARCYFW
jgi:hypothetical protein